jgi:hypothetical protein
VDNSLEASATNLRIELLEEPGRDPRLVLTDDGIGLDRAALTRLMNVGARDDDTQKGENNYGIGFKSGCMRIGHAVVVFTKAWDCNEHVGTSDPLRVECKRACTAPKRLIRGISMLSQQMAKSEGCVTIPTILWLPNGQPITGSTDVPDCVPTASDRLRPLNKDAVASEWRAIAPFFDGMTLSEASEHFGRIGGEDMVTGTRVVILMRRDDPLLIQQDSDDIELSKGNRRTGRDFDTKALHMDFCLRSYLEVMYRNRTMQIELQGKAINGCAVEDRWTGWGRDSALTRDVVITHSALVGGRMQGNNLIKSTVSVVLGFSPSDCDLGLCGFFMYFDNGQTKTPRLIESYRRPQFSFMSRSGRGEKGGLVDGMVGVIVLNASMVKVDNGKQKFAIEESRSFLEALDKELSQLVREYSDGPKFKGIKAEHEAIKLNAEPGEPVWCHYVQHGKYQWWPGWLMDRHARHHVRYVDKPVMAHAGAREFQNQLVLLFPENKGHYSWVKPTHIESFVPDSTRGGTSEQSLTLYHFTSFRCLRRPGLYDCLCSGAYKDGPPAGHKDHADFLQALEDAVDRSASLLPGIDHRTECSA